ncbi:thioesterase, FlK family [Tissierella sp.]|uniref:thioesterase family protein n=1 Tax=Tissierella sp. TaxID=41274 RepID=UPI0028589549|nr:thioesterase [Tissierella sp.]MDR7856757.1 thioesterase [Tissierella sp.]
MELHELKVGMSKAVQKMVTEDDTTMNFGSGAIKDLLATPTLAALMIEAAVNLADPLLPKDYLTIGKILNINHLQPTTKGMLVTVNATIIEIKNYKIIFEITAYDELGEIGAGYHERYVVKDDFLKQNVEKRTEILRPHP